jgi:Uncharacterized protein conserved in bacteria (DUF2188)
MARGFVHTVPTSGRWRNRVEAAELLPGVYEIKTEAVKAGRSEAKRRGTEHIVHNTDGSIARRNSYGRDAAHKPG